LKQALATQLKKFANVVLAFISANITLVKEREKVKDHAYSDNTEYIKFMSL